MNAKVTNLDVDGFEAFINNLVAAAEELQEEEKAKEVYEKVGLEPPPRDSKGRFTSAKKTNPTIKIEPTKKSIFDDDIIPGDEEAERLIRELKKTKETSKETSYARDTGKGYTVSPSDAARTNTCKCEEKNILRCQYPEHQATYHAFSDSNHCEQVRRLLIEVVYDVVEDMSALPGLDVHDGTTIIDKESGDIWFKADAITEEEYRRAVKGPKFIC